MHLVGKVNKLKKNFNNACYVYIKDDKIKMVNYRGLDRCNQLL